MAHKLVGMAQEIFLLSVKEEKHLKSLDLFNLLWLALGIFPPAYKYVNYHQ